jgi:hypothetical protein
MEARPRSRAIRRPLAGRLLLVGAVLAVCVLTPAALPSATQAAPVAQNFPCTEAGAAGAGAFQCWNWSTPTATAARDGTVTWDHSCGPNGIVILWWYHWHGSPFTVDSHEFVNGQQAIRVTATNAGGGPGEFWVTGRCRSA